jgi:hypothetical protein
VAFFVPEKWQAAGLPAAVQYPARRALPAPWRCAPRDPRRLAPGHRIEIIIIGKVESLTIGHQKLKEII